MSTSRLYALAIVLSFIVFVFAGCGKSLSINPTGPAPSPDITGQNVVPLAPSEANNKFAADLYNRWKDDDGNVFFSPFSISSALAMTYEGALGNTADEMQRVFYFLTDPMERRNAYRALFDVINDPLKDYKLSTSNNLWLEQTFPFKQEYIDIATQYYGAVPTNMDFIGNPEGSRQTINDTVEDQTEGKITNLLPGGSITPITRLVLTNAIYFKADWLSPFNATFTREMPFYLTPGNSVPVSLMNQDLMGTIEDYRGLAQVFEMPYVNREVSMFIFLPPESGMAALETGLLGGELDTWMEARSSGPVTGLTGKIQLTMPKFKFETQYAMVPTLKAMGMVTAFKEGGPGLGGADLSGMAHLNPNEYLFITNVIHKAFVAVDEKGTEAAAATAVVIGYGTTSIGMPIPIYPFRVDRPFIFMIRENTHNTILFMGRVTDPTT